MMRRAALPPSSSAGLASPSWSSPLEMRRTAWGPSSLCGATRHGLGWCKCSHTQLHMASAHELMPTAHRIKVLLITINNMVLCMYATDGWYGMYTQQPASSFGEFIVMPPDDSTGEIRPVGRMNTMYTTERCTIHTYIYN